MRFPARQCNTMPRCLLFAQRLGVLVPNAIKECGAIFGNAFGSTVYYKRHSPQTFTMFRTNNIIEFDAILYRRLSELQLHLRFQIFIQMDLPRVYSVTEYEQTIKTKKIPSILYISVRLFNIFSKQDIQEVEKNLDVLNQVDWTLEIGFVKVIQLKISKGKFKN